MPALTFDTLKFANALKAAGMPPAQAEAQARALAEVLDAGHAELATRADLRELRADLGGTLKLHGWMLGVVIAGIAALILKPFF